MANLTPVGVQAVVENLNGFMGGLSKMEGGIAGLGKAAVNVGKIAAGAAVAGVGALTVAIGGLAAASKIGLDSLTDWGEQLDRLGDQFGLTGEQASMWTVAMNKVGLSVEEGGAGLNFFTKNLDDVKTKLQLGDKAASPFQQSLDKLGISAFDAQGNVRDLNSIMPEIMNAFQAMPAGIDASALAMDLFGARGGTKFLDFLRQGSQGLSDAEAMAKAFGLEMTTEGVNAIEQYGFSLNELNLGLTGIKNQIGQAVLPYAQKFVDLLLQNMPTIVEFSRMLGEKLGGALQSVTEWLQGFLPMLGDLWNGLIPPEDIEWHDYFPSWLAGTIEWLLANLPTIKSILENIGQVISSAQAKIGDFFAAFQTGGLSGVFAELANTIRAAWPAIQAALFEWAGKFWTWLTGPGGALELTIQKIGELAGAISTEIVNRWPDIRNALLSWAGQAWDWLTGPGGPIDLASSKIIELVSAISTQIKERWPYIQSELLFWAGEFWDWFTGPGGPMQTASAQIFLFANTVASEIAKQWPGVRDALLGWAQAFWDWLTAEGGALDQLSVNMQKLVDDLNAWVKGPGKPALEDLGKSIGLSIVAGIKGLFSSEDGGKSIVQRLIDTLISLSSSLQDSLKEAGLSIAKGIILGIIEGITGKEASDQLKKAVETSLKSLGDSISMMTNPLGGMINKVGELKTALSNLSIPSWLNPGSPTPLELGIRGIAGALDQMTGAALPALTSALSISPIVAPAAMPIAGGRAAMPLTAAGGGGGVTVAFNGPISIQNGMDLEMFGAFVERRVATAMGG